MQNPPLEISCETARELLAGKNPPVLLDVREDDEVAICAIPGSRHIPMQSVTDNPELLPSDEAIVIYCHHGRRSLMVTQFLRAHGFKHVTSMTGGIQRWADVFDPEMARY